jgi:hypothetical protein
MMESVKKNGSASSIEEFVCGDEAARYKLFYYPFQESKVWRSLGGLDAVGAAAIAPQNMLDSL